MLMAAAFAFCACAKDRGEHTAPSGQPAGQTVSPAETAPAAQTEEPEGYEIFEGYHARWESYSSAFATQAISSKGLTVHYAKLICEEQALISAYEKLRQAFEQAEEKLGQAPGETVVYVVSQVNSTRPVFGNIAYCTPEELESGRGVAAAIGAGWDLSEQWKREAVYEYVFGGETDESGLKEFFSQPENALAASLSPLFMDEELAGEETASMVRRAAASFASFVIGSHGFAALHDCPDPALLMPEWLGAIGVPESIALPDGAAAAADMTVSRGRRGPVLEFGAFTVNANEEGFAHTADELYTLCCSLAQTAELLTERFERETPLLYTRIADKLGEGVSITLTDFDTSSSYAYPYRGEISLSQPWPAPHELVHVLLWEDACPDETRWVTEALAEHYSLEAQGEAFPQYDLQGGFEGYREFFRELSGAEETEDDLAFHRAVWSIYEKLRSDEAVSEGRDDPDAYEFAYGIAQLLLPELDRKQIRFMYDRTVGWGYGFKDGSKESAGNNLSYPESRAVFEYLAGLFGAEKLTADQIAGKTTQQSTGMSWQEILAGAREHYGELYGSLVH